VAALTQPYCGKLPDIAADDWFIEAAASIVLIPLRDHPLSNAHNIGFLALASEDKNRFYADMGTDFLNKIGELLSAALSRHLDLS
jgi:uncharacterized protein YigA (DUF484 family)